MDLIARVDGAHGIHFVRVAPFGVRFEMNARPRPANGSLVTIAFLGLTTVNAALLDQWRVYHAPAGEVPRQYYRQTSLADLMTAGNADLWLEIAREASADTMAAFARDRGGALLAEIRAELARDNRLEVVVPQAHRFAQILGIPYAAGALAELAELHAVEHLMGLEHAVVSWMRAAAEPTPDGDLARDLPDDRVSAGVSTEWLQWWWRYTRSSTRNDLRAVVEAAVRLAKTECRYGTKNAVAGEACDEAARLAGLVRVAARAQLFAEPPYPRPLAELPRDESDAHYCAYTAVTHAAHAIAAALRHEMDAGDANQHAMQWIAKLAL